MDFKSKPEQQYKEVGVAFTISGQANRTLTQSAERAQRRKKCEAKLRLEDHLKRFPDWKL